MERMLDDAAALRTTEPPRRGQRQQSIPSIYSLMKRWFLGRRQGNNATAPPPQLPKPPPRHTEVTSTGKMIDVGPFCQPSLINNSSDQSRCDDDCAICLEPIYRFASPTFSQRKKSAGTGACMLPCSHMFHSGCMEEFREASMQPLCPLCRAPLPDDPRLQFKTAMQKYSRVERALIRKAGRGDALARPSHSDCWKQQTSLSTFLKRELAEAISLLDQAANQGFADAQHNIGFIHTQGRGVNVDDELGVAWYSQAAHQNYAKAQLNLGVMHKTGRGVGQSDEQAIEWFLESASEGYSPASYRVGVMFKAGCGVPQSNEEAVRWFKIAADQGSEEAAESLTAVMTQDEQMQATL